MKALSGSILSNEPFENWFNRNDESSVVQYLTDVCKALEILEGFEFIGIEMDRDERDPIEGRSRVESYSADINPSRLIKLTIVYRISKDNKTSVQRRQLYFPKLIDGAYFLINGAKYNPLVQIVEAIHAVKTGVTLKTLLMPIRMEVDYGKKRKRILLTDYQGECIEDECRTIRLRMFKGKIILMLYFLAKMGITKTINYFGFTCSSKRRKVSDEISFHDYSEVLDSKGIPIGDWEAQGKTAILLKSSFDPKRGRFIKKGKVVALVSKAALEDPLRRQDAVDILCSIQEAIVHKTEVADLYDVNFWRRRLGSSFTKNSSNLEQKAVAILTSFERILEDNTKRTLRNIPDEDKTDIYAISRWMMRNIHILIRRDNLALENKRVRLLEYLLEFLVHRISDGTYRYLNKRNPGFDDLYHVFSSIMPYFLVERVAKTRLVKFAAGVNDIDLFNAQLSFSKRTSIPSPGAKATATSQRGVHRSHVGRISLNAASATDPGMTGTITPFCKVYEGGFFSEDSGMLLLDDAEWDTIDTLSSDDYDLMEELES